jgi:hypothetical protein
MKYLEHRNEIKSGDVLAWTHNGIKSWKDFEIFLVRLGQRSEYTHVGIAWVIAGRVFILEAVSSGIRIFPLSREIPCFHLKTDIKWTEEVEEFALAKVGEKYSKWEALLGLFGKTTVDDKWQCSEFVIEILKLAGNNLDCDATPSEVVNALLNQGKMLVKLT